MCIVHNIYSFFLHCESLGLGLGIEALSLGLGLEAVGLVLGLSLEPLSLDSKPATLYAKACDDAPVTGSPCL